MDSFTDLGILFVNDFTFNKHIDSIVLKAYRMLGFIMRVSKDFKNLFTLKTLYTSLPCGRIAAPNILSEFALHVPTINVRSLNALHIPFHITNYGLNDPLICCIKSFNEFYNFFDFHITRNAFKQNMKLSFFSTELNH